MSRRFFIEKDFSQAGSFLLDSARYAEEFHHLFKVLRLKAGDEVLLINGRGLEQSGKISSVQKDSITIELEAAKQAPGKKRIPVILCQAMLKGPKMDWLVEKITELGVQSMYPLLTEFVVKNEGQVRMERWQRLALSALKQSGNPYLPEFQEPQTLAQLLSLPAIQSAHKIVLHLGQNTPTLLETLEKILKKQASDATNKSPIALFVGPEGGFSEAEVKFLEDHGVPQVRVGQNILRGETAGIVATAMAQQAIDFWGQ